MGPQLPGENTEATYDIHGRVLTSKDARGQTSTTAYTPTTGRPVTSITVTNPLGHAVTTTFDTRRGQPLTVTDPNGKVTTSQYDPLGRLVKGWANNRPTTATPDVEYAYTLSNTGPNIVTAKKLGPSGNQIVSYTLYDGRFRARQTQIPAPVANGGRIIADTTYNDQGQAAKTSTFWNSTAPAATLASFADTDVKSQTRYTFDPLGRTTTAQLWSQNVFKWQVSTAYSGEKTTVTPPDGAIPTTTVVDAHGRTVELRQHTGGTVTSGYQATSYTYDVAGRLSTIVDPAGNQWTTTYNVGGRVVSSTDPELGTTTSTYNAAGDLLTGTDGRGITLAYAYDSLGRQTSLWQNAVGTGTKRAEWAYDTLASGGAVKGVQTKSTRYVNGNAYSSEVTGFDDAYRPLGSTVRLPASETTLAGPWTSSATYNVDGSPATMTYPAAGSLPAETVTTTYDANGYPLTAAGIDTYISATTYYPFGAVYQQTLGAGSKRVQIQSTVDEATGRLAENRTSTENQTTPNTWVSQLIEQYGYDNAGNVRNITEVNSSGGALSTQCFTYDSLRQLTEAWTTTATTCQSTPTQANVGGPDPYWNSYRYTSTTGNRSQDIRHAPGGDTTRTYTYPVSGATAVRPHAVTSVTASGASTGTDSYAYDNTGNATARTIAGKPDQTLTWDPEGHLASIADSGGTTSYVYTPEGRRLLATDATGTTLYLGSIELRR